MKKMLAASNPPAWFDKLSKVSDSHGATITLEWILAHPDGKGQMRAISSKMEKMLAATPPPVRFHKLSKVSDMEQL